MVKHQHIEERFLRKVNKTSECWLWLAATDRDGYGQFTYNGKQQRAHRISWILHNGEIPDGMFVCHRCDVPGCVRPDHLFIGSVKDNAEDCNAKNRQASGMTHGSYTRPENRPRGTNNGKSKMMDSAIIEMREMYATGNWSQSDLAVKYGVTQVTVSHIVRGKGWTHVGGPIIKHGRSNIDENDVREIRELLAHGLSQSEVARRKRTTFKVVHGILTKRFWQHVV